MFKAARAFSGFSVDNLEAARDFYTRTLGLELEQQAMDMMLKVPSGGTVFVYEKADHTPASFTIFNFVVDDIDLAVDELAAQGVRFERYENGPPADAKGILRGRSAQMGPDIAWFKDPAGNIISVLQN